MKKEIKADFDYINARNKLIPAAERLARIELMKKKKNIRSTHGYEFSKAMTSLSEEAGLISKGNLQLFNSKNIPQSFYMKD